MKNISRNIILCDFNSKSDFPFTKGLETESALKWSSLNMETNKLHGSILLNIKRYVIYFLFPLKIIFQRNKFDNIIAWQQFYGLNFAFWSRIFCLRKKQKLIIMTFIYKKKNGFWGKIYHYYMSFIVKSQYVDKFICFSRNECEYYSNLFNTSIERFKYVPLGIDYLNISTSHCLFDKYVFSTGRSNRDYDFLIESFLNTDYKLYIACDSLKESVIGINKNIIIDRNCHGDDMIKRLAECYCVVISVKDTSISSGQLVAIQAMQMGKPVIATISNGLKDYVEDGITGVLIDNNKKELLNALHRLYSDEDFYNYLSLNSKRVFEEKFTIKRLGQNIGHIYNSIKG